MRNNRKIFFQLFLIVYGGFLFVHIWEMGFSSWQMLGALLGGFALALLAHKRHGYLPSIFLVGHMIIEWYHHALHGNHYDSQEITFHGIHAFLDIVFLHIEAKAHYQKYALPLVVCVVVALVVIFIYYYVPAAEALLWLETIEEKTVHEDAVLNYVVTGGMLGCVLSHLFFRTKTSQCVCTH